MTHYPLSVFVALASYLLLPLAKLDAVVPILAGEAFGWHRQGGGRRRVEPAAAAGRRVPRGLPGRRARHPHGAGGVPLPMWFQGRDAVVAALAASWDAGSPGYVGRFQVVPTRASR